MKKFCTCVLSVILLSKVHSYSSLEENASFELQALRIQVDLLQSQIKKLEEKYERISEQKLIQHIKPPDNSRAQYMKNSTHERKIAFEINDNEEALNLVEHKNNKKTESPQLTKKYWQLFGTSTQMAIGGFFKLTGIKDTAGSTGLPGDAAGAGRNYLTARTIGVKNEPTSRDFYLQARETRLMLETISDLDGDNLRFCVETDFLGDPTGSAIVSNNYNVRLRKAFTKFKGFTIGQDWSTYADLLAFPETVDRNGPVGNCQIRQPQIRYSTKATSDIHVDIAIENPESEVITKEGTLISSANSSSSNGYIDGIKGQNRMPDLVAAMAYKKDWGHFRLAMLFRENAIMDNKNNRKTSMFGASLDSTLLYNLFGKDSIVAQAGFGTGSGRYFTEQMRTATYYDGEKLHNQRAYHASIGYKHQWQEKYDIRSTIAIAYARFLNCNTLKENLKNPNIISKEKAEEINKYVASLHLNIIGNVNECTKIGLEYVIGKRKTEFGLSGTLKRITFAVQINF